MPRLRLALVVVLLASCGGGCQTSIGGGQRSAPAAAAPPTSAASSDGAASRSSAAGAEEHNLRGINAYRARLGLAPVSLDPRLSAFALEGSRALAREHRAHGNFRRAARSGALFREHGFAGHACENQGDPHGWTPMPSIEAQIDDVLAAMWREGPGGGHYDNMANPRMRRVGVGLVTTPDGRLYLTNDFSE